MRRSVLLLGALTLSACATGGGSAAGSPEGADRPPDRRAHLLGCGGDQPHESGYPVVVSFTVTEDGGVDPRSVRALDSSAGMSPRSRRPEANLKAPPGAVAAAETLALGCRFEPAMRDGLYVRESRSMTFRIPW